MTHTPELTLADRGSFKIAWMFPVNYRIAAKEPCDLNGMGVENDEPRFATCVGRSNVSDGWCNTLGGGRCTTSALRHVAWSTRLSWIGGLRTVRRGRYVGCDLPDGPRIQHRRDRLCPPPRVRGGDVHVKGLLR
ncbi:TIGR03032 family protein [Leisingera daeponensis]|uniref:TIGR03032 family protein n=1 Tax=Leisingera daeponensis TaxID=405746 RepID=A0ABS7NLZ8_9RHOB|nr:TIGR03032 family protein [Leisingera daeponensis]